MNFSGCLEFSFEEISSPLLFLISITSWHWCSALQPSLKYSQLLPYSVSYLLISFTQCPPETGRQSSNMSAKSKKKCLVWIGVNSAPLSSTFSICRLFSAEHRKTGSLWNNMVSAYYLGSPWLHCHNNSRCTHTDRQLDVCAPCSCNREKLHKFPQSASFWCLT